MNEKEKENNNILDYSHKSIMGEPYTVEEVKTSIRKVILECINLLSVSGENTKAIVAEKLRGIVE